MLYHRRFSVAAPLDRVAAFHRRIDGFRALRPPGVPIVIHHGDDPLVPGAELEFTLWLGVVPVRWLARIEGLADGDGFLDRQVRGPFKSWTHRHRFEPLGPDHTIVDDTIEAELSLHPLKAPIGALMWSGLPLLFRWRAWRTRRRLEPPVTVS